MRRIVLMILCLLLLPLRVSAENQVGSLISGTTVSGDGSCQVSLNLTLHLDTPVNELHFPIPAQARSVRLGGRGVLAGRDGPFRTVNISKFVRGITGSVLVAIQYELPKAVAADETGKTALSLPLLCGFDYPVDTLEFTVTMPGTVENRPTFTSGYFQESIESYLTFTTSGASISGATTARLVDHETLTMNLDVDPAQFTIIQPVTDGFRLTDWLAVGCACIALLYWLLTMRCLPPRPLRRPAPPAGLTAGELGCRLTAAEPDLTMMVVTWAQLGYLLIQLDDNGRVLLHKRMDMGNERSGFEQRCFKSLFGKKRVVDGSGFHYAKLCRKLAKADRSAGLFRKNSGNPRVFRILLGATACFVGFSLALLWGHTLFVRVLLFLVLGVYGAVSGWLLRKAACHVHLRRRELLTAAGICTAIWVLLGITAGLLPLALLAVGSQFLGGLAAGYGGRRTDLGRQTMQDILGLRRYLKHVDREELHRIAKQNPCYFYEMAPYALALGVDRQFARHYGASSLPECPYLVTRHGSQMTAPEWMNLLRDAVALLDERQKQLPLDRILGK